MTAPTCRQSGFSLLEVLITIIILAVGLLGLAGLQARAFNAEAESFSRAKALMLANQMAERIAANLSGAKQGADSPYPIASVTSPYNTGSTVEFGTDYPDGDCGDTTAFPTVADRDLCEWNLDLKGATETVGSTKVGGLTSVRGCVRAQSSGGNLTGYVVQVAWRGRDNAGTASAALTCGAASITSLRRVISVTVPIATLDQS